MLDNRYLLLGLNALSRAHELNYFVDGHRGGAIISGVYLCRENDVETGVPGEIASIIDAHWTHSDLCAPFPDEDANPKRLGRIVDCMSVHIDGLREAGHNVILPTLALKAFRDMPEAVTEARVMGICRLIESFSEKPVPMADDFECPDMNDRKSMAAFILEEFVGCTTRFTRRGQGWSGHLLTYGKAMMDLRDLGYTALADQAAGGFQIYIRRIRSGPQETDGDFKEHTRTDFSPLQTAYWQRQGGDLKLGHKLKYPYGFYGLLNFVENADLERRSLDVAYRIF